MKEGKPIVPQHIVTMVALDDEGEAHFVCACMNSTPARFTLEAYSQKGGKSFATPQALEHVRVPAFDRAREFHVRLAQCSRLAHEATKDGRAPRSPVLRRKPTSWPAGRSGRPHFISRCAAREHRTRRARFLNGIAVTAGAPCRAALPGGYFFRVGTPSRRDA